MNVQLAELQKIYVSNKYSPNSLFLNPFSELLFAQNWVWPEQYISQKKHNLKKPHSNNDTLKQKIKDWYKTLDIQSKLNCLLIKDRQFIENFRFFLSNYSSQKIYNMRGRKSILDYGIGFVDPLSSKGFELIIKNLRIALLKEPILYLSKNIQNFLNNQLIKWMEIISNHRLFQFANKLKKLDQPQDNPLWFSSSSFQRLQHFLVNQYEKSIIKCYFSRDRLQSDYLNDIKLYCQKQLSSHNKIDELLNYSFIKLVDLDDNEIFNMMKELKEMEGRYQREKENIIERMLEEEEGRQGDKSGERKKRKRIRKKVNKQITSSQIAKNNQRQQPMINCNNDIDKEQDQIAPEINQINDKQQEKFKQHNDIINKTRQQEQTSPHSFYDQISQISKSEDVGCNQTEITIVNYLDESQQKQNVVLGVEEGLKSQENLYTQNYDTANNTQIKSKKKSKKQKQVQEFHNNIIKNIRNSAFTEFIDVISIQSNNLYSYKLAAYQFIAFFISSLLPPTNITLFGSNAVGLSLASSDIDIMISNNRWGCITQVKEALYQIGNEISKMGWVVDYKLILNAKVPVLKLFIDPKIGYFDISPLKYSPQPQLMQSILIKADIIINIQGQQNIGCESTYLMKQWLTDYPQLQRIILFFKYLLWYYGLNENYRGGICSYCLFLMVISCVFKKTLSQNKQSEEILTQLNDDEEGTYIIEILRFYSEQFNPLTDEIYIEKSLKATPQIQIKTKNEDSSACKRYLNVKIVDPINGEYIESSFSKFDQIQQLFSMILVESMKADDKIKNYLNTQEQFTEEFLRIQNNSISSSAYNVLTKNSEPNTQQTKTKKLVKKVGLKLKKNEKINYYVKEIISIGFKIGIQNWMRINSQEKLWI